MLLQQSIEHLSIDTHVTPML